MRIPRGAGRLRLARRREALVDAAQAANARLYAEYSDAIAAMSAAARWHSCRKSALWLEPSVAPGGARNGWKLPAADGLPGDSLRCRRCTLLLPDAMRPSASCSRQRGCAHDGCSCGQDAEQLVQRR